MAELDTSTAYTEEQAIAGMIAGHRMAGMPPTEDDIAAARRVFRGESTPEEENARLLAQIVAARG
ncbi:MAG: antitoxin VbhA family protein [Thermomicrobiales bacterium]|nr:antitoxin VbhA family protein [Thermomicrobiales bacterium]